jgi:hypothetical protein
MKDVLYIGRYDWSHHWHNPQDQDFEVKFHDWAEKALNPDGDETGTAPEIADIQAHKQLVRQNERTSTLTTESGADAFANNYS